MLGVLTRAGHRIVSDPARAEVVVINTCSFVRDATEESLDTIFALADLKRKGSCRRLVVTGCLPQRYGGKLAEMIPEVDFFIGTGEINELPALLADEYSSGCHRSRIDPLYDHRVPRVLTTPPGSAYLKVSEGCSNRCSYCVVPDIRGPRRSRPLDSILAEAWRLVEEEGVLEANLVAQDLTAYGEDLADGTGLEELLEGLSGVNGLKWIRLLYCYPRAMDDRLVGLIRDLPAIVPYIDLPLQHISDDILVAMGRKTGRAGVERLIDRLRASIPGLVLRTTFIVGFPGETEIRFEELAGFAESTQFERMGVFVYSPEEGTRAASMPDRPTRAVALDRRDVLMEIQAGISYEHNRTMVGTVREVLVEGRTGPEGVLVGRTAIQAPEVDGEVHIVEGDPAPGLMAKVEISSAMVYDLAGRALPAA